VLSRSGIRHAKGARHEQPLSQDDVDVGGIERHRDYLYYNAFGRLRNRELAEDAVHDSFVAALHGAPRFAGQSSERTWLTGILKHKVCDQLRRACRDRAMFQSDLPSDRAEFEMSSGMDAVDPSAELERKELRAAIQEAIARLPQRLAKAFSLYEAEDWNGRDVCTELNISENNLWIMLHRARKELREQLSVWYGDRFFAAHP
jgi:RNA polymerase sigma-70 factor, ECF subfamily